MLAVVGGGAYYTYQKLTANNNSASANLDTTTVQTGSLVASVTASGSLASPQTGDVAWQSAGTVGQLNVKVGDKVRAGDVLLPLDDSKLDTSIVQAQNAYNDYVVLADTQSQRQLTSQTDQANKNDLVSTAPESL